MEKRTRQGKEVGERLLQVDSVEKDLIGGSLIGGGAISAEMSGDAEILKSRTNKISNIDILILLEIDLLVLKHIFKQQIHAIIFNDFFVSFEIDHRTLEIKNLKSIFIEIK